LGYAGAVFRSKLGVAVVAFGAMTMAGCNEETRRCQSLMTTAQGIVNKVDGKSRASVEESLAAVESARAACEKAKRGTETDELVKAKNELSAHLDYMKRKAGEAPKPKISPDQLAELVKKGDPDCPKGQAYRPSPKQEIRCTGPQIADMNWKAATTYFGNRGYKMTVTPPTVRAEYGAELLVFTFTAADDEKPAKCLTYYPVPGETWQEATGKVTGVQMRKLENAKTVKTEHGEVPLRVDASDVKLIVYVGECS
jgi:hypothetical protein